MSMGKMRRGVYIGTAEPELTGKRASLRLHGSVLTAQFDDVSTGLGYGWHNFPTSEWALELETELNYWKDA